MNSRGGVFATSVLARRREWGVLRAIGMPGRALLLPLAFAALVILLLGALGDAGVGIAFFKGPVLSLMDSQGMNVAAPVRAYLDRADPDGRSIAIALRAAAATAVSLVAFQLAGLTDLGVWAAIAGALTSLADVGGLYRARVRGMLETAAGMSLALFVGSLIADDGGIVAPLMFVVGLVAALAAVRSPAARWVGLWTLVFFLLAVAYPASVADAATRFGAVWAGSAVAAGLVAARWWLGPGRPVERSLARLLSGVGASLRPSHTMSDADTTRVHESIRDSRVLVAQAAAAHGRPGRMARRWLDIQERAVAIYRSAVLVEAQMGAGSDDPALRKLGDLSEKALDAAADEMKAAAGRLRRLRIRPAGMSPGNDGNVAADDDLGAATRRHARDAAAAVDEEAVRLRGAPETVVDLRGWISLGVVGDELHAVEGDLKELQLAIRCALVDVAGPPAGDLPWAPRPGRIRDHLGLRSYYFRHGVRLGLATALAVCVYAFLLPAGGEYVSALHNHGYWITLSVVVILLPSVGELYRRVWQRVGGTLLGASVAVPLAVAVQGAVAYTALIVVFTFIAYFFYNVRYAIFVVFLTIFVVLEFNLMGPPGDWVVAVARLSNTVMGAIIAVAVGFLVLPNREKMWLPLEYAAVARELASYAALTGRQLTGGDVSVTELRLAGQRLNLAIGAAEQSWQRLASEPGEARGEAERLDLIIVLYRRLLALLPAVGTRAFMGPDLAHQTGLTDLLEVLTRWFSLQAKAVEKLGPPETAPGVGPMVRTVDNRLSALIDQRMSELRAGSDLTATRRRLVACAGATAELRQACEAAGQLQIALTDLARTPFALSRRR